MAWFDGGGGWIMGFVLAPFATPAVGGLDVETEEGGGDLFAGVMEEWVCDIPFRPIVSFGDAVMHSSTFTVAVLVTYYT